MSNPCDSEAIGGDDDPTSRSLFTDEDVIPKRIYGWGVGLLVLAIVGHLSIPWLLLEFVGKAGFTALSNFPNRRTLYETLSAFFVGLWIAQYVAIWLWLNGYVVSRAKRWLIGLFLSLAISYAAMVGMSLAWGPPPSEIFFLSFLGSAGVYTLLSLVLGILLSSSKSVWKPLASTTRNTYSLMTLLWAMIGSALVMLAIKSFRFNGKASEESIALPLILFSIWLVWLAVAISILTWLQLGTVFSLRRWRFRVCFLVLMILGPATFHAIGLWVLSWAKHLSGDYSFEELMIAYSIEIGLVAGVAMAIGLLPRNSPVAPEEPFDDPELDNPEPVGELL